MTRAPGTILRVRTLLLDHLNVEPSRVRSQDLEPAEVGIVGDSAHRGGYHCGSDRVVAGDYSVVESSRDRNGLTLDASALDVGQFQVTTRKGTFDLRHFSRWLAGQCAAKAPDCRDIREVIYSPDGKVVRRWDALGRRSSGDSSHLWHTHISFFRDAIKAGRDQTPVFRRYLTTIGLLEDEEVLTPDQDARLKFIEKALQRPHGGETIGALYLRLAVGKDDMPDSQPVSHPTLTSINSMVARVSAQLTELLGRDMTDEPEIIAGVLQGLTPEMFAQAFTLAGWTPEQFAAALPEDLARAIVDALAARLAQPE